MAEMREGAAWSAVAHSDENGAPEQVLDVGAIMRSWDAAEAPAARDARCGNEVGGRREPAEARAARTKNSKMVESIVAVFSIALWRLCVV